MSLPILSAEQRSQERKGIKCVLLGKSGQASDRTST